MMCSSKYLLISAVSWLNQVSYTLIFMKITLRLRSVFLLSSEVHKRKCVCGIVCRELRLWTFYVSVMQESPRVGVRWSIISLNGISYKDAGEYRCQARNMAGISEAPIKLKVVGVTRQSRLPKRKSQKTASKSSSKYGKPYQTNNLSAKENQILQNITPPSLNKTQTAQSLVSKVFPVDKRRKMNLPDAKIKTQSSVKSPGNSTAALLPQSLVWDPMKLVRVSDLVSGRGWVHKENVIVCLVGHYPLPNNTQIDDKIRKILLVCKK